MKNGMESSVHVLMDGSESMELVPLVKLVCSIIQQQKYVKVYVELMKLL